MDARPANDQRPEDELVALRAEIGLLRAEGAEIKSQAAELREALVARDTFIAIAGRELRNSMGAVMLATTNLRFRAAHCEGLPDWVVERLDAIAHQSWTFVRRATTLLDVSELTSGGSRRSRAHVDWSEVIRSVVDELALEAGRAGCPIDVRAPDPVEGFWDREAIEQITLNLLSNAIKNGPGRPVQLSVGREARQAVLRVRDYGGGIGDADRARAFEPFERVIRQGEFPGFGLGLWIARQLALAHGGEMEIEAGADRGSLFTVRLAGALDERP
jgi:signal transduction histidine kinase